MSADDAATAIRAKTILIVEDEPSLVAALSYNLRKDGYEVLAAR